MSAPADPLGALEASIVKRLKAAFDAGGGLSLLKKIEPIETPFDEATSSEFRISPPALYVLPLKTRGTDDLAVFDVTWAVYGVSNRATSMARTKGGADPHGIGAYAIATHTALALQNWTPEVEGASALDFIGIENLTGLAFVKQKFNVQAATFTGLIESELVNPGGMPIADFLKFWADVDVRPFEAPPETLPAARDAAIYVEPQS